MVAMTTTTMTMMMMMMIVVDDALVHRTVHAELCRQRTKFEKS